MYMALDAGAVTGPPFGLTGGLVRNLKRHDLEMQLENQTYKNIYI